MSTDRILAQYSASDIITILQCYFFPLKLNVRQPTFWMHNLTAEIFLRGISVGYCDQVLKWDYDKSRIILPQD